MISRILPALLVSAIVVAHAPSVSAQSPRRVVGFWAGIGGGLGPGAFECDACGDVAGGLGPTGLIVVGRTFSPKLAFGVEANGWRKSSDAETEYLGSLMVMAYLFPLPRSGLHVDVGAGLARGTSEAERPDGERDRASTLSPGVRIGAGYDLSLGSEVSFTPFASYTRALPAELKISGVSSGLRVHHSLLQLGLALHWNFTGAIAFPKPTTN